MAPVSVCGTCGTAAVRHDVGLVEPQIECRECGAANATAFVCDQCSTRYRFDEVAVERASSGACPKCGTFVEPGIATCPTCGTPLGASAPGEAATKPRRTPRRVKGDFSKEDLKEIARIPGVDARRSEALCRAGYNALWKVKRASEQELAGLKEIGPKAAKTIKESVRFMLLLPRRRSKEEVLEEERECPLCHCVTSLFAKKCQDCGAEFDEEELEIDVRAEVEREPDRALLAFYDMRLRENESDSDLWYARALLLLAMNQRPEALKSIDTALRVSNGAKRVLLARSRVLSGMQDVGQAAAELKEVAETASPQGKAPARTPEAPLATEDELHEALEAFDSLMGLRERECPMCGQHVLPDAPMCPVCGHSFSQVPPPRDAEGIEGADRIPEPALSLRKSPSPLRTESAGRTSTNLRARRGLINGHGLVNGKGRVNGLTNGNGFVNGSAVTMYRLPTRVAGVRYAIMAGSLLMAFFLAATLFLPLGGPVSTVVVDGSDAEWAGISTYLDPVVTANPDVSILRYGVFLEANRLYAMVQVSGRALGDTAGYDAFYMFFDVDRTAGTGYQVEGLGADYVAEVYGGAGLLVSARLYEFPLDAEMNWSRRSVVASVPAAVAGSVLELAVDLDDFRSSTEPALILIAADDFDGTVSRASVAILPTYGAIRIRQRSLVSVLPSGTTPALELEVAAIGTIPAGGSWTVGPFSFVATTGLTVSASPSVVTLSRANPTVTVVVSVTATAFVTGSPVEVSASSATATLPVTIAGEGVRAYFEAVPTGIRVDGLFADWAALRLTDADPNGSPRAPLDIESFGGASNASGAYFYLQVAGPLVGGIPVPQRISPSQGAPGGGGPSPPGPPLPRVTGEDIARVYIDANASDSNGVSVGGILADYIVEVRGIAGRITSQTAYRWASGWIADPSLNPRAAKNATALEGSLGLPATALNGTEMVLTTTDWSGAGDTTTVLATRGAEPPLTRSGAGFVLRGDSSGLQVIHASPLSDTPSLDGTCDDLAYGEAGAVDQSNMSIKAGRRDGFVWICIEATADTDNGLGDFASLHFDRDDSGAPLSRADRRIRLDATTSTIVLEVGDDSGTGWVPCTASTNPAWDECYAGNAGTASFSALQRYEFMIHYHDIWNTSSLSGNELAGFAVLVYDEASGDTYRWGNTDVAVDTANPDTWGHVALPEFGDIALPVGAVVLILLVLRRRRASRLNTESRDAEP